jgi:Glycosyltransferase
MQVKILIVISGLSYSGAEIVLKRFLDKNYDIDPYFVLIYKSEEVYNLFLKEYGEKKVLELGITHNKNNLRFMPYLEALKIKNKLKKLIESMQPNLIYANNTIETMLIGLKCECYDVPILGHIHDMKSSIKTPIRVYYTMKAIDKIDKTLTVSFACKSNWGKDMKVIYNGLSKEYFNLKYRTKVKNIGFVGTLSFRKGFDLFLKAAEGILKIHDNAKVLIVYNKIENGKLLEALEKLKNEYKDRVIIYKELSSNEIKNIYDNIDILVVPSRQDPLPTVIMESIARGCLAIGSEIDGIPELLNHNKKLMFKKEDLLDLQNKINYVMNLKYSELKNITDELYTQIENNFQDEVKKEKLNNEIFSLI